MTVLEAFDRNGLHVGSATLQPSGEWCVYVDREFLFVATEAAAEQLLRDHGAVTVPRKDARKGKG